jgi:hypothetical protein
LQGAESGFATTDSEVEIHLVNFVASSMGAWTRGSQAEVVVGVVDEMMMLTRRVQGHNMFRSIVLMAMAQYAME